MELTLKATNKRIKKKRIVRDFQWYDSYSGQILRGRGGEMRFRYDPTLKRSVPYVVDAEDWVTENNYEELIAWVAQKGFDVLDAAPNHFMMIDVPVIELDDVMRELYNKKIVFDWGGE